MHARIDQLLSLRDGEPVEADVRVHVRECAQCTAEAARLAVMRDALRSMSTLDPPDMSAAIVARVTARPSHRKPIAFAASIAALVACALGFVALRDTPVESSQDAFSQLPDREPGRVDAQEQRQPVETSAQVIELIAESRQLEEVLAHLPDRPSVQRVSLSTTVDSIEERIQWLDWQLAYSSEAGLDQRQAQRLWSERVELMDSLVKVRYAESAPMAF